MLLKYLYSGVTVVSSNSYVRTYVFFLLLECVDELFSTPKSLIDRQIQKAFGLNKFTGTRYLFIKIFELFQDLLLLNLRTF